MKEVNTNDGLAKAIQLTIAGKRYELSEALQKRVERLQFVADEYHNGRSRRAIVKALMDEWGLGAAVAYSDFALAKKFFVQENLIELRDVHASILLDNILEHIEVERAKRDPDGRALAALDKVHLDAIMRLTGDKEAIDWTQVYLPQMVMIFDPALINSSISGKIEEFTAIQKKYEKRILNWDKAAKRLPETAYEDVEESR